MNAINKKSKWTKLNLVAVALVVTCTVACDKDNDTDNGTTEIKTSGFVINGLTSSETATVKYVAELPADGGTINIADGQDFVRFWATSVYDHALYIQSPDGTAGFSKMVVNADGRIVEEGIIPTINNTSAQLMIKDSETGVFQDRAVQGKISVFNPKTMQVTRTIDLTEGPVPGNIVHRYQSFYFRGNDIFAVIRGLTGEDFNTIVVHQGDINTGKYIGWTERIGDGSSPIDYYEPFGQQSIDDQGNLYIVDAGNIGGTGLPARVSKIAAGSNSIDADYKFEPAKILNAQNVFLPCIYKFATIGNGKAVCVVNSETPQEAIAIVQAAGGIQNLTREQINEIFYILATAASAQWCILDLNAQTVTPIGGIPKVGIFVNGTTFTHNGNIYLPAVTTQETAYYRLNVSSGTAVKAFNITGATLNGMYNIANNN
ncbi:hypothetical protein H8B06_18905 [Sphingobacterium sp. DN00404]|uniref:DUF4374 domain-containing protein n=1 Tax=Sphingobacterium micropteri TaxID=2763501 RepID=A0ABR7YU68_9SPHI|nr:hypothetical protein [Sphingobacterium micropteri]MBD1434898.1 hypothetical protein [Sphingobacterium micropteri]